MKIIHRNARRVRSLLSSATRHHQGPPKSTRSRSITGIPSKRLVWVGPLMVVDKEVRHKHVARMVIICRTREHINGRYPCEIHHYRRRWSYVIFGVRPIKGSLKFAKIDG